MPRYIRLVLLSLSLLLATACAHTNLKPQHDLVVPEKFGKAGEEGAYTDINGDGTHDLVVMFGNRQDAEHAVKVWLLKPGHSKAVSELMAAPPNVIIQQFQHAIGKHKADPPQKMFMFKLIGGDLDADGKSEILLQSDKGIFLIRPWEIIRTAKNDGELVLNELHALYLNEGEEHGTLHHVELSLEKAPKGMYNIVLTYAFGTHDMWVPSIEVQKTIFAPEFNPYQGYSYLPADSEYRWRPVSKRGQLPREFR